METFEEDTAERAPTALTLTAGETSLIIVDFP